MRPIPSASLLYCLSSPRKFQNVRLCGSNESARLSRLAPHPASVSRRTSAEHDSSAHNSRHFPTSTRQGSGNTRRHTESWNLAGGTRSPDPHPHVFEFAICSYMHSCKCNVVTLQPVQTTPSHNIPHRRRSVPSGLCFLHASLYVSAVYNTVIPYLAAIFVAPIAAEWTDLSWHVHRFMHTAATIISLQQNDSFLLVNCQHLHLSTFRRPLSDSYTRRQTCTVTSNWLYAAVSLAI